MAQALILAAGVGSRLHSDEHKALALVSEDQSMLGRIADQLNGLGFDIALVVGYQCESLVREFGHRMTVIHNPWFRARNSLYSLWLGAQFLRSERLLTGYCDAMVSDSILEALVRAEPETAAVVPGYDGRGIQPWIEGGIIKRVSEAGASDLNGVTFSGFSMRTRAELLKLAALPGFYTLGASHGIAGCKALVVKDNWAVNVNTSEDLRYARRKIEEDQGRGDRGGRLEGLGLQDEPSATYA